MSRTAVISFGSFTLAGPSDTASLEVSSSVDMILPESLASGTCGPAMIAARVRTGDLWVVHQDSCLVHVSFQVNGTPVGADRAASGWGRVLAGCEVGFLFLCAIWWAFVCLCV